MNKLKKALLLIVLVFTTISSAFCFRVLADSDKTQLIQAKNDVETIINNQDTSVSGNTYYNITAYRAFVEAIDNLGGLVGIQIVIDDALAIQIDVDNLTLDINTAMNGLVLYDTYNLALNNLLQARSLNISIYTLDSQTLYLSELERIEITLYNPTSGEAAIQTLITSISDADDLLVLLANKSQLLVLYNQLRSADTSDSTMVSKIAYNLELNRLYDLIYSPNLDDDLANSILLQLNETVYLLEGLADYSNLQDYYEETLNYRQEDYSISSFQALTDAQQDALYTLSNPNTSQQDVDNMETTLLESVSNLQQKIEKLYIMEGESVDINQYVTLGSTNIIYYVSHDGTILSVDNAGLVTAKNYGETNVLIYLENGAIESITVYVKAKPKTAVYVLTFSIPVASASIAMCMIYVKKDSWKSVAKPFKKILKKRK